MKTFITSMMMALAIVFSSIASAEVSEPNGWSFRFSYAPTYFDLGGIPYSVVKVNPTDAGFLRGDTKVKAKSGTDFATVSLGVQKVFPIEDEWVNFSVWPKIGANLQFSWVSPKAGDNSGLCSTEQNPTDKRPKEYGSFGFAKITPGYVTPDIFIGADINLGDWVISPEVGLVYRELRHEWGDYRYGVESKTGSLDEWALGFKALLSVGYDLDERTTPKIFVAMEQYKYSALGNIQAFSAGVSCEFKF